MTPQAAFWYSVFALWLIYLPYGGRFIYNYLRHRKHFAFKATGKAPTIADSLIFQITTNSVTLNAEIVGNTIEMVRETCATLGFKNYTIRTCSDDSKDVRNPFGVDEAMVTPADFQTNAVRKARSMQYAVERYRAEPGDKSKKWIFHLDEESVVQPQTLEALLNFIASGRGILAEGPILYPGVFSVNRITRIADAIRSSTCYFCVDAMTGGKVPAHIHGSNLLVRMDVECDIGWALGKTIAEDQLFGFKVFEKYPQFGWHGGVVLESSPRTVRGMIAQRKRWVVGTLQNWKHMPSEVKRSTGFRFGIWGSGFFAALVALPFWVVTALYVPLKWMGSTVLARFSYAPFLTGGQVIYDIIDGRIFHYLAAQQYIAVALGVMAIPSLLIWVFSYLLGFYMNHGIGYVDTKISFHIKDAVLLVICLPIIGILENYPLLKGLVEHRRGRADWVITPK